MPGNKYLSNNAGTHTEIVANQTSAGAADANKIVALDATGKLDTTLMPVGIGADIQLIVTSEALSAGDLGNVFDAGAGVFKVRKADASVAGKEAHCFVLAAVAPSATATCYFEGTNTQVTGLAPGVRYLSNATPGGTLAASPVGAGVVSQRVGFATSSTTLNFQSAAPIVQA